MSYTTINNNVLAHAHKHNIMYFIPTESNTQSSDMVITTQVLVCACVRARLKNLAASSYVCEYVIRVYFILLWLLYTVDTAAVGRRSFLYMSVLRVVFNFFDLFFFSHSKKRSVIIFFKCAPRRSGSVV